MKNYNYKDNPYKLRLLQTFNVFGLLTVIILTAVGGRTMAAASKSAPAPEQQLPSMLSKCRTDLAKRLKIQEKDIKLADIISVTWPDTALGLPEIGKVYAQVTTPGQKLIFEARNQSYLYTTSDKVYKYGGPLHTWAYSMLYLQPVSDEANLNGDLYQCSLIGTNSIRLLSGVSDYYPQDKGAVIAKRRTSRSSHDLLYVEASQPGKEKILYHAMDFGAAAFNGNHDEWAGYVRPGLGSGWKVVVNRVGQETSKAQVLPMPEGMQPGEIAWSGDTLMILVKKGDSKGLIAFETNPRDKEPVWKQASANNFPGYNDFVLNKSESLVIEEVKADDKVNVEVARVWFTGDRNVVATISDFTMQGYDLLGPYAFIWGEKNSRLAVFSVDISSGDTVVSYPGKVSNIKPFAYPAHNCPIPEAPIMVD